MIKKKSTVAIGLSPNLSLHYQTYNQLIRLKEIAKQTKKAFILLLTVWSRKAISGRYFFFFKIKHQFFLLAGKVYMFIYIYWDIICSPIKIHNNFYMSYLSSLNSHSYRSYVSFMQLLFLSSHISIVISKLDIDIDSRHFIEKINTKNNISNTKQLVIVLFSSLLGYECTYCTSTLFSLLYKPTKNFLKLVYEVN